MGELGRRWYAQSSPNLGTIHLRRRQIFTLFWPLPPYHRQFFTTIRRQIWQIFDPSPLKNTEILNAWSNGYQNITWYLHLNDTSIFSTLWSKTGHLKYFSGSKLPSLGPLSLILGPWITFGYLYIGRTPWKRHEVILYILDNRAVTRS